VAGYSFGSVHGYLPETGADEHAISANDDTARTVLSAGRQRLINLFFVTFLLI
jgi:hypothetical protein